MATSHDEAHGHAHGAQDGHGHGGDADGEVHSHVASWQFYVGIFGGLIVLTLLTVGAARFNIDGVFGSPRANTLNLAAAIIIATMKAGLVAAFFMHLRHDKLFNTLAFLASFLFLGIFILLTYDDVGVRAHSRNDYSQKIDLQSGQSAPGGAPATSATVDDVSEGHAAPAGGHEAPGGHEK
jgi:cytochrome c oxidase subunit 4